jgi:hypothetical protein
MTTINPVVDSQGNYLGSEIVGERQGWQSSDSDIIERNDGSRAHIFGDVELSDEVEGFNFDSYAETLRSAYPTLDSAIAWAAQGGAVGLDVDAFNRAIDTENLEALNENIERLTQLYQEALVTQQQQEETTEETDTEPTELDEWFAENMTEEVITQTVNEISSAEYSEEQVDQMAELRESYAADSPQALILNLGTAMGLGEASGQDAIEYALSQFSEAELAAAYFELTNILNQS